MPDETRLSLAKYRLEKAYECHKDAVNTMESGAYNTAANRVYYSIFHAMRAILALDEFDSKKHSGIIAAFRQRYIKTGVFPVKYSEIIELAYKIRSKSDYDDFYVISKDDVSEQITNSKEFLSEVTEYLNRC